MRVGKQATSSSRDEHIATDYKRRAVHKAQGVEYESPESQWWPGRKWELAHSLGFRFTICSQPFCGS